jgi:hypothetical protein
MPVLVEPIARTLATSPLAAAPRKSESAPRSSSTARSHAETRSSSAAGGRSAFSLARASSRIGSAWST